MVCETGPLKQQRLLASLFLAYRASLDVEDPALYENPIFSYPEESEASEAILSDADTVADHCWEAAALELVLDIERHLSLLARTSSAEELQGNASVVCVRLDGYDRLLRRRPGDESVDLLAHAAQHLGRTWQRLGLVPEQLCPASGGGPAAAFLERDSTEVHPRCKLRDAEGFDAASRGADGCRAPGFGSGVEALLPEAVRAALAARKAAAPGRRPWPPAGCGARWRTAKPPTTGGWEQEGRGMFAKSCALPFLTYWPSPVATITRCKYCAAGSLLNLQPGERVLDFGAGCGLGAAWLAAAFGAEVVVVDAFKEHADGAAEAARRAGASLAASCVGDVGLLEAFTDASFDAVVTNSALQVSRSFALQCAVLRTHFVRLLRPGGVLWWGDLNSPHHTDGARGDHSRWAACLAPLVEAGQLAYATLPELATFGATETWSEGVFTLLAVRLGPAEGEAAAAPVMAAEDGPVLPDETVVRETRRQASLYGCPAAARLGFPAFSHGDLELFEPGPGYWPCVEERLEAAAATASGRLPPLTPPPRRLAPRLWSLEHFASEAEVQHLAALTEAWRQGAADAAPPDLTAHHSDSGLWVDDVIAPTGLDAILDELEDRLERDWGLPRAHADPWHVLHYAPGYRAHWRHTDCNHPGFDPGNDRFVTALVWLSPCAEEPCGPERMDPADAQAFRKADGATVFPLYGVRARLRAGGLVLYSSFGEGLGGMCDDTAQHFAAPLSEDAPAAKVLLQKWYYARPVEPSSPPTPRASCDAQAAGGQCKRFLAAPGSRSAEVQSWLAQAEAVVEQQAKVDAASVRALVEGEELRTLRAVLEQEVAAESLGRSAHWRALYLAGNFQLIGWQVGVGGLAARHEALEWLRAALRRCPVCEDVLSLITRALADDYGAELVAAAAEEGSEPGALPTPLGPAAAEREAREALGYARRLAALGAAGASTLEEKVLRRLRRGRG